MSDNTRRRVRPPHWLEGFLLAVLVSGCAHYDSLPLPARGALRHSVNGLDQDGVDTRRVLSADAVARLAVLNNPELRAVREQQGVAGAQLLQAGLLPNPAINGTYTPVLSGPGVTPAWTAGLSQDIRSLITLSSRRAAATAATRQISASVLWQEWQVIGKARLLVVQIVGGDRMVALLRDTRSLLAGRYGRTKQAVARGDADLTTLSPDLAALGDVEKQVDDLDRQQQTHRHDLDALLGLLPTVSVALLPVAEPPVVEAAAIQRALRSLADRRPDLIALRFGYASQDAKFRSAVLSQFPTLNIGLTGGSDTSNVHTIGPQITLELPIFDRNQGNIAIERATRRQLQAEYASRLATAESEATGLLDDIALNRRQLRPLRARAREARQVAGRAEAAFTAGNLTERAFVDFVSARLARQQELLGLEQSLREQQVALDTMIGAGMPLVALPKDAE